MDFRVFNIIRKRKNVEYLTKHFSKMGSFKESLEYMRNIASTHIIIKKNKGISWTYKTMKKEWRQLKISYNKIYSIKETYDELIPSSKWVIDNYYLINERIKTTKKAFKRHNCTVLPAISVQSKGIYPRVYVVAKEIMSVLENHYSNDLMMLLLENYQSINPLKVSELWALPVMFNLCILEDIALLMKQINTSMKEKVKADLIIDKLILISKDSNDLFENLPKKLESITTSNYGLSFSSQILYRLKERGFSNKKLDVLSKKLPSHNESYHLIVTEESKRQAGYENQISNLILSIKRINEVNWEDTIETISIVDLCLSLEDCNVYSKMSFKTKEEYRHKIESLANRSDNTEQYIAETILKMTKNKEGKAGHVGYYLLDEGRNELYDRLNIRSSLTKKVTDVFSHNKNKLYFFMLFVSIIVFATTVAIFHYRNSRNVLQSLVTFFLFIIPAYAFFAGIINRIMLYLIKIQNLPAMNFDDKIPDNCQTVIAIPVIISSREQVDRYIIKLEQIYLTNKYKNLSYVVLSDFADSPEFISEEDNNVIEYAKTKMTKLNSKYFKDNTYRFYLFHRNRIYQKNENIYMGWERKRGKLEEFNRYILEMGETSFFSVFGDISRLRDTQFILTIDADTKLVKESVNQMIGVMAHPLNKAEIDKKTNRVIKGYGLIQPRISTGIKYQFATMFTCAFGLCSGFDPYTTFVSDIYQDVFREGIFTGKGIYDLKVVQQVLDKRIPQNSVLSHDLLEGSYVRCGYASDIQMIDGTPYNLISFMKRQHRWIRGDWQLLPWILGKDKLNFLPRWQMVSNLLRSISPIAFLSLFIFYSLVFDYSWLFYPAVAVYIFVMPIISHFSLQLFKNIPNLGLHYSIKDYIKRVGKTIIENVILFISLPYRAYISLDAIIRTVYRLCFSRKKLLEWQPQEHVEKLIKNDFSEYLYRMWSSVLLGSIGIFLGIYFSNNYLTIVSIIWFFAPLLLYPTGLKNKDMDRNISLEDQELLLSIARDEYRYFEENQLPEYNYLVPDNIQYVEDKVTAIRTSPTNIGLQLLTFLTARDFGFISFEDFVTKVSETFKTISKLEKWHGHLYNWYNIQTLDKLMPYYISTVDSGNFIGFLIAFKNGMKDMMDQPIFTDKHIDGIHRTLKLAGYEEPIEYNSVDGLIENLKSILYEFDSERNPWINISYSEYAKVNLKGFINDIQNYEKFELSINDLCQRNHSVAKKYRDSILKIIGDIDEILHQCNFAKLYDPSKNLFYIGYNNHLYQFDSSHYDFMASEARLTSYIAIAKGDIKRKHWYYLSRPLTLINNSPTMLSWGGTMFEYFMPHLVLKTHKGTTFHTTLKNVTKEQISFAKGNQIPYGISESAYYRFDEHLNYQYRAFGIASLGLRPDLHKFLVVSPYSSFLSMEYNFKAFMKNIKHLIDIKANDRYGFYDAIDFMTGEDSLYKKSTVIKAHMCHHKGMSLVAINNFLNNNIMQKRFHKEPIIKSAEILLEEIKHLGIIVKDKPKFSTSTDQKKSLLDQPISRIIGDVHHSCPLLHVISNDHFQCVLSSTGSGFNKLDDTLINNWSSDPMEDSYGTFIYVKDLSSGKYFSITYAPTFIEPTVYEVIFSVDKVEYKRVEGDIDCKLEVAISPDSNMEVRRVSITNKNSRNTLKLELTSFTEIILDSIENFKAHPAFSRLFIETEFDQNTRCIIASRRAKLEGEKRVLYASTCLVETEPEKRFFYDTDRRNFIGRGRTLRNPRGVENPFNSSTGAGFGEVIDPCVSIRVAIDIPPNQSRSVSYINAVAYSKQELLSLMKDLRNTYTVNDIFDKALFDNRLEMIYLGLNYEKVNRIQDIVTNLLYAVRDNQDASATSNTLSQSDLWKFGISGDYPIMLVKIEELDELEIVRDAITAMEYLGKNQINFDLVIINKQHESYNNDLKNSINDLIHNMKIFKSSAKKSSVFQISSDKLSKEEVVLFDTISRIVFARNKRLMGDRYSPLSIEENKCKYKKIRSLSTHSQFKDIPFEPIELDLYNGIGGFRKKEKEYVIELKKWQMTPMPWVNVIANDSFGCLCSESGLGYTYNINSQENRLTRWSNDPVLNPSPEIIYFKDEKTNKVFSTTALPIRENDHFRIIHGFGYTRYLRNSEGIKQELRVFVHESKPLKYILVTLENATDKRREINSCYYADLVLGVNRETTCQYIETKADEENHLLFAQNIYNSQFPEQKAFMFSQLPFSGYTCDKYNFFSGNQSDTIPLSLYGKKLDNTSGKFHNSCFAIQNKLVLEPYEKKQFVYIIGQAEGEQSIISMMKESGTLKEALHQFDLTRKKWSLLTSRIQVRTPDDKMNYMLNGWLMYQTLSCRIYARSGFYQSSGAYGFRDQLQDGLSLINTHPEITRELILKAASHQFIEGDVMHWWHENSNSGVRTKISDDRLWMPYVLSRYIKGTSDLSILEEKRPYLGFEQLKEKENERFGIPEVLNLQDTVYEHCKKAIDKSMRLGSHNLPLIGSGDWNDGMNMIGNLGKGESIWLAFFLYDVLEKFKEVCQLKNDQEYINKIEQFREHLIEGINRHTWDGSWFLRAYYDDGSKLGSKDNLECKIDAISQSWSVISGAAEQHKKQKAMESVLKYLVDDNEKVLLLLQPPFHRSKPNPGYIQGYLRGIRENGGQYTHGATWSVIALTMLNKNDDAYRIYDYLNPLTHTEDIQGVNKYMLEPYVMAADVYHNKRQKGRGGWSWYTGAAGWMYQSGIEHILGFVKEGEKLYIRPHTPKEWDKYEIKYTYFSTNYEINVKINKNIKKDVKNELRNTVIELDGQELDTSYIPLTDDKVDHMVYVEVNL